MIICIFFSISNALKRPLTWHRISPIIPKYASQIGLLGWGSDLNADKILGKGTEGKIKGVSKVTRSKSCVNTTHPSGRRCGTGSGIAVSLSSRGQQSLLALARALDCLHSSLTDFQRRIRDSRYFRICAIISMRRS